MAYPIDPSSRGGKGYHRYIGIKKVNKQFVRAGCGTRPSREGRAEGGVRSGPLLIKLLSPKPLTASDCVVVTQTAMSVVVLLALPCTLLMRNPPLVAVRPAQKLPPVAMSLTAAAPALGAAVAASHLCTKVPIEMDR